MMKKIRPAAALSVALLVGACGTVNPAANDSATKAPAATGAAYAGYGVVESIELVKAEKSGFDAYRMKIRMDNGNYQNVMQNLSAEIRTSDRVQIDSAGTVRRY